MEQKTKRSRSPTARTPEQRENQLISMAYDLAEKRLRDGSASSQEVTHFLKMGSQRERAEMEKIRTENEMLKAKTDALRSQRDSGELFEKALEAFGIYSGEADEDEDD